MFPFKPVKQSGQISARQMNRANDNIERLAKVTAAPPLEVIRSPDGVHFRLNQQIGMHVRITDDPVSDGNLYSGIQQATDNDGSIDDLELGLEFTSDNYPLVEITNKEDVPIGSVVWAWPSPSGRNYEFSYGAGAAADVQQIRTTGAATTIDGFKFYPGYTQELDPDGTSSGVMGFLDVTAVALMQYSNYDLTVTGSGGCYTARRHTRIESVTLGGNPYPVYVTTEFPSLRPDCTVGN